MLKANGAISADPAITILDVNIGAALTRLWRAYLARRRRRQTIAMLSALSDRTLKDIGMSRAEIYRMANGERVRRSN